MIRSLRLPRAILLMGMIFLLSGCGPSAQEEADFKSEFELIHEMFDLLNTIKDDKSAEMAKTTLDNLYTRIQELDAKNSKLPKKDRKKLYERNKLLVDQANGKIAEQWGRHLMGDLPKSMLKYLSVIVKEGKQGERIFTADFAGG